METKYKNKIPEIQDNYEEMIQELDRIQKEALLEIRKQIKMSIDNLEALK